MFKMLAVTKALRRKQEVLRTLSTQSAIWQGLGNDVPFAAQQLHGGNEDDRIQVSPSLRLRRLEGKVTLISGGASGIGAVTAKLFGLHGSKVVVADINEELGRQVAEEIGPGRADFLKCDATQEDQIATAVDLAVSRYGSLDVLVTVVGGVVCKPDQVEDVNVDYFDKTLALNVRSALLAIKHAARVMIPQQKGSIVSFGSCAGILAVPGAGISYSVSKFAVNGLTKLAASDLDRHGIRVNSIAASGVVTQRMLQHASTIAKREVTMAELRAAMEDAANFKGSTLAPSDVAEAALFLASNESAYISGHTLIVDGGFSIKRDFDWYAALSKL